MLKLDIKKLLLLQAKACLNTNELAERANMPRITLTNIIHGKRNATTKTIGLLAKALGVEVIELIMDDK
ncbi:helix-turn-helix domain-containing protein [Clostridium beijerinckii]|uniref:Helix-turn-helix transcriptional regulator n=1 Tax=Clostridium beijerinckii TaxID=1520 RepID=A0A7X9XQN7_CLOBE|nr:helix-turn-helix transcriptional regulator [Clostridium beijerinckii]